MSFRITSIFRAFPLLLACLATGMPQAFAESLEISRDRFSFFVNQDGSSPNEQKFAEFQLSATGSGNVNWVIVPQQPWLFVHPLLGSTDTPEDLATGVLTDGLAAGLYEGSFQVFDQDSGALLLTQAVKLRICGEGCVFLDNGVTSTHSISPFLFGAQAEWLNSATGLWDRPVSKRCYSRSLRNGSPRPELMDLLAETGIHMLRYPGGTPSDFFHWAEAIGPVGNRIPQIDPFESTRFRKITQCPTFGPDEAADLSVEMGAPLMITANVGTGTAEEAAAWLQHYTERGISAKYWEIGNEIYLEPFRGVPYAFTAYKTPENYAGLFDQYSRSLRAIDPDVQVGLVAQHAGAAGTWTQDAMSAVTEPVDFVALHMLAPADCADVPPDQFYAALLTSPELYSGSLDGMKQLVEDNLSTNANYPNIDIALTEHGTFLWICGNDEQETLAKLSRVRSLGAALSIAMSFHVYMAEPRLKYATHLSLSHPVFQAPVNTDTDGFSNPVHSAFHHVFRIYSQTIGGKVLTPVVRGVPTFDTESFGTLPSVIGVPSMHSVAVMGPEPGLLRLFVVNRSLDQSITAEVALDGFDAVQSVSGVLLTANSIEAANTSSEPYAVEPVSFNLPASLDFDYSFPAHSLVVLSFQF